MDLVCIISAAIFCPIFAFFVGVFVGTDRMRKAVEESSVGQLRIDRSEPDEPPRPFLEITKGSSIESISKKSFVILKVINENYISCD